MMTTLLAAEQSIVRRLFQLKILIWKSRDLDFMLWNRKYPRNIGNIEMYNVGKFWYMGQTFKIPGMII